MGRKLVLDEQPETVVIGVGKDGCDPKTYKVPDPDFGVVVIDTADERWAVALARLPEFCEKAEAEWAVNQRNPEYKPPGKSPRASKGTPVVDSPGEPAATAAPTVTEPPAEELPLLDQKSEEEMTMTTDQTPPVDPEETPETTDGTPETPESTPETPEAPQEAPETPEAPQETPEPPEAAQPAVATNGGGSWRYYVGEQGPFETLHSALLAHGVSQGEIDSHKYWHRHDRLPKPLADAIRRVRVGTG